MAGATGFARAARDAVALVGTAWSSNVALPGTQKETANPGPVAGPRSMLNPCPLAYGMRSAVCPVLVRRRSTHKAGDLPG